MFNDDFMGFVDAHLAQGHAQIVHTMRILLFANAPALFDRLNFHDETIFLEPLLFAFFNTKDPPMGLEQILFGSIEDPLKPAVISVVADRDGVVYLPHFGYLLTPRPEGRLQLSWDHETKSISLSEEGAPVDFVVEPLWFVEGTSIEILRHNNPFLRSFYADRDGRQVDVEMDEAARRHARHVNTAFRLMREHYPRFYDGIVKTTRKIAIFHSPDLNSFASLSCHGIAFFNASEDDDEIFFLEDIAHQCGHVLFNAATFEKERYFVKHPETPLLDVTGVDDERRTLYVTFHGIFTETTMIQAMNSCFDREALCERQAHELGGRMAFLLRRFGCDLRNLAADGIFSAEGRQFYDWFLRVFQAVYTDKKELVALFDTSNQPYNFSYEKLVELNPLVERAA